MDNAVTLKAGLESQLDNHYGGLIDGIRFEVTDPVTEHVALRAVAGEGIIRPAETFSNHLVFLQGGASVGGTFGEGKLKVAASIDPHLRYQSFVQRAVTDGAYGTYFDHSFQTGLELHGGIGLGRTALDLFGGGGISPAAFLSGNMNFDDPLDSPDFHLSAGAQVGWIF